MLHLVSNTSGKAMLSARECSASYRVSSFRFVLPELPPPSTTQWSAGWKKWQEVRSFLTNVDAIADCGKSSLFSHFPMVAYHTAQRRSSSQWSNACSMLWEHAHQVFRILVQHPKVLCGKMRQGTMKQGGGEREVRGTRKKKKKKVQWPGSIRSGLRKRHTGLPQGFGCVHLCCSPQSSSHPLPTGLHRQGPESSSPSPFCLL